MGTGEALQKVLRTPPRASLLVVKPSLKALAQRFGNADPSALSQVQVPPQPKAYQMSLSVCEWEPRKTRDFFTFEDSLARLIEAGYTRHPRPQEVASLLLEYAEKPLTEGQETLTQDIVDGLGEWLSLALYRDGRQLHCYLDPPKKEPGHYRTPRDMRHVICKEHREFGFDYTPPEHGDILIKDLPQEMVTYLWTRPFSQLPPMFSKVALMLPPEHILKPVAVFNCGDIPWLNARESTRASRGVRKTH